MSRQVEISDKWKRQIETWVADAGFGPGAWSIEGKKLWLLIGEQAGTIDVGDGIYVSRQTSDKVHKKIIDAGLARRRYRAEVSRHTPTIR